MDELNNDSQLELSKDYCSLVVKSRKAVLECLIEEFNARDDRLLVAFAMNNGETVMEGIEVDPALEAKIDTETGLLTLNLISRACPDLVIDDEYVSGTLRSGSQTVRFMIPIGYIVQISSDKFPIQHFNFLILPSAFIEASTNAYNAASDVDKDIEGAGDNVVSMFRAPKTVQ